jgi:hypothetical protein
MREIFQQWWRKRHATDVPVGDVWIGFSKQGSWMVPNPGADIWLYLKKWRDWLISDQNDPGMFQALSICQEHPSRLAFYIPKIFWRSLSSGCPPLGSIEKGWFRPGQIPKPSERRKLSAHWNYLDVIYSISASEKPGFRIVRSPTACMIWRVAESEKRTSYPAGLMSPCILLVLLPAVFSFLRSWPRTNPPWWVIRSRSWLIDSANKPAVQVNDCIQQWSINSNNYLGTICAILNVVAAVQETFCFSNW